MTSERLEALLTVPRFLRGAEQDLFMPPLPELDGEFRPCADSEIGKEGDG
jgi:hypothetical protein